MIKVYCQTNLDLHNEEWPTHLPAVPNIGDNIRSKTKHGRFQLELKVVNITWVYTDYDGWIPEIELHMTDWQKQLTSKNPEAFQGSIRAFYEWYAPAVGLSVGTFI
jgi:hypothetical protein